MTETDLDRKNSAHLAEMQQRIAAMSRIEKNQRKKELRRQTGLSLSEMIESIALDEQVTPAAAMELMMTRLRSGHLTATGYFEHKRH